MDEFDPQQDDTHSPPPPEPSGPQVRPWVRCAARFIDSILLFGSFASAVLFFIDPSLLPLHDLERAADAKPGIMDYLLAPLILFAYVFVESAMLAAWGTTPGKAFLKVRLRNRDGSRLNYGSGLNRAWEVWIRGMGLGIPIVTWFTQLMAFSRLNSRGITSWDEAGGYTVSHQIIGPVRSMVLAYLFLLLFYLVLLAVKTGAGS